MSYKSKKIPGLQHNIKTGLYEITDGGLTYSFEFNMLASLKNYLQCSMIGARGSVNAWYNSLRNIDRQKISVTGSAVNNGEDRPALFE